MNKKCNLLRDKVYSVREGTSLVPMLVSLEDILCTDRSFDSCCGYPDLDFAQKQLLVSITQSVFQPRDFDELRHRYQSPMSRGDFEKAAKKKAKFFEVTDKKHPFMQRADAKKLRDSKRKEHGKDDGKMLPPQALFPFLPKGNNKLLYNKADEIVNACPACVAKMLYFRAMHGPSMGGGFASLSRGSYKKVGGLPKQVTGPSFSALLVDDKGSLRTMIWMNVLHADFTKKIYPLKGEPTWFDPWVPSQVCEMSNLSLLRGLFWQPWPILVEWEEAKVKCDACGHLVDIRAVGWYNSKVGCKPTGLFFHPHSVVRKLESGPTIAHHVSFNKDLPFWADLMWCLVERDNAKKKGTIHNLAALGVNAGNRNLSGGITGVIVGGYIMDAQACIIEQKRFDAMSIHGGFLGSKDVLAEVIRMVTGVDRALCSSFGRLDTDSNGKHRSTMGLSAEAQCDGRRHYYRMVEHLVMDVISSDPAVFSAEVGIFATSLRKIAGQVFENEIFHLESPFPMQVALADKTLRTGLNEILGGGCGH